MNSASLKRLAGVVWLAVGGMLAWRGVRMLQLAETTWGLALALALGLLVGAAKGHFVLSRTARRNIRRIDALEEPRPWNVFSGRFVIVIGMMIGLGIGLRTMAEHGWLTWALVGGIYVGIGAGLAVSSSVYFMRPRPALSTRTDSVPDDDDALTGLLVTNLGTPDAPTPGAVRRYLRQFLGDPRVIEVNRLLWAFVLNVMILPRRSRASAEAYAQVWDPETGSPLLHWTRATAAGIAERLGDGWRVEVGMRYGRPSLTDAITRLQDAGCRRIIGLPLYPQYSNTTTGTTQARVAEIVSALRNQPAISWVPPYPDDPAYVTALATRVRDAYGDHEPDHYVFSFHGLPERYVKQGDPYVDHCARTSWALAEELGLDRTRWEMVFQSRFGDEPWLQPYLDEYVPALAARHDRVLVATPGFAADCLETIEEVGIRLRATFEAAGGRDLILVPALNDSPHWIEALTELARGAAVGSLRTP